MLCISSLCARHVKTELLNCGSLGVKLSNDLALVHNKYSVRDAHNFIKLKRYQKNGVSRVSLFNKLFVNKLNSADVKTARRLNGNEKLRISVNLSCHYRLLLVSARHTSCSRH